MYAWDLPEDVRNEPQDRMWRMAGAANLPPSAMSRCPATGDVLICLLPGSDPAPWVALRGKYVRAVRRYRSARDIR